MTYPVLFYPTLPCRYRTGTPGTELLWVRGCVQTPCPLCRSASASGSIDRSIPQCPMFSVWRALIPPTRERNMHSSQAKPSHQSLNRSINRHVGSDARVPRVQSHAVPFGVSSRLVSYPRNNNGMLTKRKAPHFPNVRETKHRWIP